MVCDHIGKEIKPGDIVFYIGTLYLVSAVKVVERKHGGPAQFVYCPIAYRRWGEKWEASEYVRPKRFHARDAVVIDASGLNLRKFGL